MKPASAIAMLPAYDLLGLYGSFSWPRRLPTMSAIPESVVGGGGGEGMSARKVCIACLR